MLRNLSKRLDIASDYEVVLSGWKKSLGMMFLLKFRRPLIFVHEVPVVVRLHTFFMFFGIDVVVLDSKCDVVCVRSNLVPFRFFIPDCDGSFILELEKGSVDKFNIEVGDKLVF